MVNILRMDFGGINMNVFWYHQNFSRQRGFFCFKGIGKVRVACSTRTLSVTGLTWYYVSLPVGEERRVDKVGGHPVVVRPGPLSAGAPYIAALQLSSYGTFYLNRYETDSFLLGYSCRISRS